MQTDCSLNIKIDKVIYRIKFEVDHKRLFVLLQYLKTKYLNENYKQKKFQFVQAYIKIYPNLDLYLIQ